MTSHAAVVARGMGKPCIAGCESIRLDMKKKEVYLANGNILKEGDVISIDGGTGSVIVGEVKLVEPQLAGEFKEILKWADQTKKIEVRANADTPEDAKKAREFGAKGIGLCHY